MWEAKVFAAADATDTAADVAETNWKHKVTPDRGDLIMRGSHDIKAAPQKISMAKH